MKYDIITIGGATEDITFYTKEGILVDNKKDVLRQNLLAFEYGAKIKIDKAHSSFGGGATNVAVSFSNLGLESSCLCAVGSDLRGKSILANLKKYNIDIALAQKIKNFETGFSFLLVGQNNEHIVFSNRAANNELEIKDNKLKILKKAEWIYLTSLSGKWQTVLKKVFSLEKTKIAWNPGYIQIKAGFNILKPFLKKTKVLILNKDEAIELVLSKEKNANNNYLNNIKNLLKSLKDTGSEIVLITNGKYGADAYDGLNFYHQDILKEKKRIDTTGVGDAFGSSFVAGLKLYKGDIKKSILLGAKNSASVIAEQGAQNGLIKISKL